ncbi:MAG: type II secretion system major pseudopilin GspG [Bdellovibrionales bacterium]|nr:type II secretion system major pseudopilin GspG [Bdellovibrionales bacterium]
MLKKWTNLIRANEQGMTLLEIMVVLVILGGLATVLIGQVMGRLGSANIRQAKIQIGEYQKNLDMYYTDCGQYPSTEEGLQALVEAPPSCSNWGPQPYVKKVNKDPWRNDLVYESDGATFVLKSLGKDRVEGGSGENKDISSEEL